MNRLFSLFLMLTATGGLAGCERVQQRGKAAAEAGGAASVRGMTGDLVGEWSSAARTDASPETIIFAQDRSVVLRDGNAELRLASSVPSGGRVLYEVVATESPARLDLVVQNGAGEVVSRVPGIVKVLTDDQIQYCVDFATLTRPVDFNNNCVVLTKLSGTGPHGGPAVVERVVEREGAPAASSAWVTANSPRDGFVALRSEPGVRTGYRITQIPHGTSLEMYGCRPAEVVVDRRHGQWCEVGYNGTRGWAFDGFLLRQ